MSFLDSVWRACFYGTAEYSLNANGYGKESAEENHLDGGVDLQLQGQMVQRDKSAFSLQWEIRSFLYAMARFAEDGFQHYCRSLVRMLISGREGGETNEEDGN
jgi:hypothetical protein